MPTIILRHVTKRYEGTRRAPEKDETNKGSETVEQVYALNDLSLLIRNGETLGILGPSGCGKTTLLKIIAGVLPPDSGEVFYDNVSLKDIPAGERGIGMVFQNYALYPHMEAWLNIGFYDVIHKQPEKIPERIEHIVKVMGVDLKHLLSRKPPTLSGGEQQRVAVARCLARDPKVFLFDEPLSSLDARLRVETRLQLHRLLRHYQITSVYVTHDQTEAMALAHRIAIMRDGKIEQIGTVQALYETPVSAFVAQFFGTPPMNLFEGWIMQDHWEGRSFDVSPIRPGLTSGQGVWLGIRPEHVEIVESGIAAKVDFVEPILTQQRQLVYLKIGSQSCIAAAGLEHSFEIGQTIHLHFPTERLYLFDKKTDARIG
ncbi:MAG: ABC transporter ATP-binding protein [Chloroflexi bacterium]|nr:ABC transporter ATP-binding protein [Chloroflexota bacterium]